MYAEVAINAPVQSTFHYRIPPELEGGIAPGHLVRVNFGTAQQPGIVLALHQDSPIAVTKPILERLDPLPVVTEKQIELAYWMSRVYLAPLGICLWVMLPPGISGTHDLLVTLRDANRADLSELEQRIVALLERRGALRGQQIKLAIKDEKWESAVKGLAKAGVVTTEAVLTPPSVRPKYIQMASLAIHPDQIPNVARHLGKSSRQADLLEVIASLTIARPTRRPLVDEVLKLAGVKTREPLNKLADMGHIRIQGRGEAAEIALELPPEAIEENLIDLRGGYRDLHILKVLAREADPVDVSWVYAQTDSSLADLKRLAEDGLILLSEKPTWRDSLAARDFVPAIAPRLIPEQRAVWQEIEAAIKQWGWEGNSDTAFIFLLHGVTGSGKTEIYLRSIELTLAQGRQAIFLVPEIALTPQTIRRVAARFPKQVTVIHSGLSEGERYDAWRRAREGLVQIVVGARSALFTPFPDVGLIILDEEHDHSYKQSPPMSMPYYDARRVAEEMIRRNHGVLILGSATPDVELFYRAQQRETRFDTLHYVHLPSRIMGHRTRILEQAEREQVAARYYPATSDDALTIDLPPVQVVDMREELKAGNTSIFSQDLQVALANVLQRGEQAILFLNRRGQSTYVFCRDCGYIVTCSRCDMPMTFHREGEMMHCHHCGLQEPTPNFCPSCGSLRIRYFGAGTQQVEAEVRKLFPDAHMVRWDADTASKPGMHEVILQQFIDHRANIMVGTQMIAKGLDLPLVTLVGVISADVGLGLPDFRGSERTFQLLTQVAGRAGRGLLGGKVILQTYRPTHYAIVAASKHDYAGFYEQEITYRRELGYPPFRRLARVVFSYPNETKARTEAERAAAMLKERIKRLRMTGTEIIGPAPCFFKRLDRDYRWHLLLRGPNPAVALQGIDIARGWQVDIDPMDVL